MAQQLAIANGPSKLDVMLSLLEGNSESRRSVVFHIGENQSEINLSITAQIDSLEREDGSGENWNFKGTTTHGQAVVGYYSTQRRVGWIAYQY